MEISFLKVFIVIAVIMLMIVPGFVIKKLKMIDKTVVSSFAIVLLYICQPFLTIKAFALSSVAPNSDIIINMAIMFFLAFLVHIVIFLFLKLVFIKQDNKLESGAYMLCSLFSNASFMGIPFVELVTNEPIAVIYAAVFMCAFNILVWTLGIYLITGNIKNMKPLKGITNPPVIVLVIALPLFFIPEINFLKNVEMFGKGVCLLADMTLPLSMIIIGIRLADIKIKSLFNKFSLYVVAAFKLLLVPLLAIVIMLPFFYFDVFTKTDPNNYIIFVLVMLMSMPPAASAIAMSERFKGDVDTAVLGFILATLISLITVPLIISLIIQILY